MISLKIPAELNRCDCSRGPSSGVYVGPNQNSAALNRRTEESFPSVCAISVMFDVPQIIAVCNRAGSQVLVMI